jgi:hypothetical protein
MSSFLMRNPSFKRDFFLRNVTLRFQTRTASGTFQCRVNEDRKNLKFHRIRHINKSDTRLPYKTRTSHTSPQAQRTGHRSPQRLPASNKVGATLPGKEEPGDRRGEIDFRMPRGPGGSGPHSRGLRTYGALSTTFGKKVGWIDDPPVKEPPPQSVAQLGSPAAAEAAAEVSTSLPGDPKVHTGAAITRGRRSHGGGDHGAGRRGR